MITNVEITDLIWDDYNISHISRHNVRVNEVEQALRDKDLKFLEGHHERFMAIGKSEKRMLTVVLAKEANEKMYVVTARDASKPERRYYRNDQTKQDSKI